MVLNNKLNIHDSLELARVEEKISKQKTIELYKEKKLNNLPAGSYAALRKIHYELFSEIYDFAGCLRTENIAKGNFRFASALYLEQALKEVEQMSQGTVDEIIEKYVEMNVVHPFREGNGRAMRLWLDDIFRRELGICVDWQKIDKEDYLLAMERSPIRDLEIKHLLKAALTNDINNAEIWMKGIDKSYEYEGYTTYETEKLIQENGSNN